MRFLITGAAGFIGFHTCSQLLKQGHEILGVDNLNDYYDVSLKKSRNQILKKLSIERQNNYYFYKVDISDLKFVENIFKSHKQERVNSETKRRGFV